MEENCPYCKEDLEEYIDRENTEDHTMECVHCNMKVDVVHDSYPEPMFEETVHVFTLCKHTVDTSS